MLDRCGYPATSTPKIVIGTRRCDVGLLDCLCLCVYVPVCVCLCVLVASRARGVASCIAAPAKHCVASCVSATGHAVRCIVRFGLRPCIALQRAFRPPAMQCVAACVSATGQALRCIARCGRCIVRCGRCIVRCVYMFACLHAWHCIPTACPSVLLSSLELPCCS